MLPKKIEEELEKKLKELKISKKLKEKIKEKVIEKYEKSKIEPGEAIGPVTAQSFGEPATQLILRSFHYAGISELQLTLGLPRMVEILDAKRKPSTPSMTIYLKEPYNKDKDFVEKFSLKIREIRVEDLISSINMDLVEKMIIVEFDEEKLRLNKIDFDEVVKGLRKYLKSGSIKDIEGLTVKIKPNKRDVSIKDLYMFKEKVKETIVRGVKGIRGVLPVFDDKIGEYVIKTYGSNLLEIMKIPEVDETRTITNDILEIERVLGIEAARQAIVNEILSVLEEQGLDIDIRYILLIADVMTFSGRVLGVTRYGVTGQKPSVLARAAFEIPIKHFIFAAISGESDKMRGIVENVIVNQPVPVGTGMVRVVYKGSLKKEEENNRK